MIKAQNVTIGYGSTEVLKDVSMTAGEGEVVTIIGGSGTGKSTLLRAIMNLIPIKAGRIFIEDSRTDNLKESDMNEVRKKMGMVFQEGALFDSMNVFENVAFALRRHTKKKEKEIREIVEDRLEAVNMQGREKKMPSELSGGMRRRVGIARALAMHPMILLYDEPTTGLDPILTNTVTELILKMRDRYKTTSVIVTHDMRVADRVSDRLYMIHDGAFIAEGTPDELRRSGDERLHAFLGVAGQASGQE